MQENIIPDELIKAHQLMMEFSDGFEELYVQQQADQIHFIQPCSALPLFFVNDR